MRRTDPVGSFIAMVGLIALFWGISPSLFEAIPILQLLGPVAVVFCILSVIHLVRRGHSFDGALGRLLFSGLAVAIVMGGFMWYVTHMPIQMFPAHIGDTPQSGTGFLPNILR